MLTTRKRIHILMDISPLLHDFLHLFISLSFFFSYFHSLPELDTRCVFIFLLSILTLVYLKSVLYNCHSFTLKLIVCILFFLLSSHSVAYVIHFIFFSIFALTRLKLESLISDICYIHSNVLLSCGTITSMVTV